MARTQGLRLLLVSYIVAILAVSIIINCASPVKATPNGSDAMDIQVDHTVQIRNGGLVVLNDTIRLSTKSGDSVAPFQNFLLGFPFFYRSNLERIFAYDSSIQQLNLKRDVGLGKTGFYGVEISFPQSIDISDGGNYEFTVVTVFSNLISFEVLPFQPEPGLDVITFNATFPAYPSLTQNASLINFNISLPSNVNFKNSSFAEKGISLTNTTLDSIQIFNYTKSNLDAFAYEPFWLEFEGTSKTFIIIEAEETRRDITVDSRNRIFISDSYEITPKSSDLSQLKMQTLQGAFEVSAWDQFGNPLGNAISPLTFTTPLTRNKTGKFKIAYQIPWTDTVSQNDWQNYRITLSSIESFNWTARQCVVTITLPEGAKFTNPPNLAVIQKEIFQETLSFVYYNVTPFQNYSQEATYEYTVFWASFRPTIWVGTAAAILGVFILILRAPRPTAPPIPTILVKPEELRSYVDTYEEKRHSLRELETLGEKARKRKMPRRRYKVRKKALESRLSVLSKDLVRLKEKLQNTSSRYADMMRQIEIAEAELEGIEAGIRRTETRYRRGEISIAAYQKLLEDYYRRRERAKTTIDGVLIRLREEIA